MDIKGFLVKDLMAILKVLPEDMPVVSCNPVGCGDNCYTANAFYVEDGAINSKGFACTKDTCPDGVPVKCLYVDLS